MKSVWKKLFGIVLLAGALCVGQMALAKSSTLELQATVAAEHTIAVACGSRRTHNIGRWNGTWRDFTSWAQPGACVLYCGR